MPAPVNVKLSRLTVSAPSWPVDEARWAALNKRVGGNPDFYPLTVKAAYVIGIIHDICTSVSCLLRVPQEVLLGTYIPAYGVCASGIEILGRCILGVENTRRSNESLKTGLKWLCSPSYASTPDSYHLIQTRTGA